MLAVLVALLAALGPLLRGSWDPWAQSLLHGACSLGLCAWLSWRTLVGHIPLPSTRTLVWAGSLAFLGGLSTALSPVRGLVRPEWYVLLEALWLFPAMAALTKDERAGIDEAVRVAGWILMTLAFYQRFSLGEERPASALVNQNVYAGAVLLLLPLAIEKRDWLLSFGLVWTLWWTKSVGAWLGLSVALIVTHRRSSAALFWAGAAAALVCGVALYNKLGTPEVVNRWWWWSAAARMAAERPLLGFGPGSFAYVSPAVMAGGPGGLFTLYAHNYPLQVLAELGLPFAALWFGGLWRCLVRGPSHKGFGVLAALVHSLWDYPLSMPGNLWLLSYFAASSIPDSSEGVNVPARQKVPVLVLVAGLGLASASAVRDQWRGHSLASQAAAAMDEGRWSSARSLLEAASRTVPDDPQVPVMAAAVEVHAAYEASGPGEQPWAGTRRGAWLRAAASLERSVRLNPFRPATRTELALAYRRLGLHDAAEAARRGASAVVGRAP